MGRLNLVSYLIQKYEGTTSFRGIPRHFAQCLTHQAGLQTDLLHSYLSLNQMLHRDTLINVEWFRNYVIKESKGRALKSSDKKLTSISALGVKADTESTHMRSIAPDLHMRSATGIKGCQLNILPYVLTTLSKYIELTFEISHFANMIRLKWSTFSVKD